MRDPFVVIERPLLTEKSTDLSALGKYTFRVSTEATKIEIAKAVEFIYAGVHVTKVNTMMVKGKKKRVGRFPQGKTKNWKKAIVTLEAGQTITLFEGI